MRRCFVGFMCSDGFVYACFVCELRSERERLSLRVHNILNLHWEGTLAMQQTRKIENRNVEPSPVVAGKH
jgi:hypothetical protein